MHGDARQSGQSAARDQRGRERRYRALTALQREVSALCGALERVRAEATALMVAEQVRPLVEVEDIRARELRSEGERLRWKLQCLRDQFEALRAERNRTAAGAPLRQHGTTAARDRP